MSVDLSGEITAIATAVLAAFAIVTAAVAYMAFRKQAQELAILQQQMKEQQDVLVHEADERHRAQASRIFISLEKYGERPSRFNVANTSDQPVYDAEIRWYDTRVRASSILHSRLGTILPGDRPAVDVRPAQHDPDAVPYPDGEGVRFTMLEFRDAAGTKWTRTLGGGLGEGAGRL